LKDETNSWTNLQSSEEPKTHGLAGGQHSGERAAKRRSSTALIKSLRCSAQASGTIYVLAQLRVCQSSRGRVMMPRVLDVQIHRIRAKASVCCGPPSERKFVLETPFGVSENIGTACNSTATTPWQRHSNGLVLSYPALWHRLSIWATRNGCWWSDERL